MRHALIIMMVAGVLGFLCSCTGGRGRIPITPSQEGDIVFLTASGDESAETPADDAVADAPPPGGREMVAAASVLQVNSTFITIEDVLQRRRADLQALPVTLDEANYRQQTQTIVRDAIRELMRQALIYDTANSRLSDEEKERIDNEIKLIRQDMISRAGGSLGKLHEQLAADGLTLSGMLTDHRRQLVVALYSRGRLQLSMNVSRQMMWEYYQAHESEFTAPKRVAMQMIVVDARALAAATGDATDAGLDQARATARTRIQEAQAALRAGAAFGDVAKNYSTDARAADGGLWPLMSQGSHRLSKVESAAFELERGQTSDIIEDGDCVAIVRAARIEPGGKTSFENAQRAIEDKLHAEQYRALQEKQFQELIKTAYIQQNDDFLDRCVQRAMDKHWRR